MNSTTTNGDNKMTWGLDTNSLDDWLENDLKQTTMFQCRRKASISSSSSSKYSLSHIISPPDQEGSLPEASKEKESITQQQDKSIPPHLIPLIKIYSLLNTIRQNEQIIKDNKHTNHNAVMTPPSPNMSLDDHSVSVNKKRSRGTTTVDINIKRQRNTDAARRSRLRKTLKMENLEKQANTLKTDNERLRVKVAVLETEICHATEKEHRNRQRVLELETQLANAHKQLVQDFKK